MSEYIDHEAARDCANEAVEFYANNLLANGYRLSNAEQRDYLVSTAYLDLHAQLAAERARVEAVESALKEAIELSAACIIHSKSAEEVVAIVNRLTAILNAQGDNPCTPA